MTIQFKKAVTITPVTRAKKKARVTKARNQSNGYTMNDSGEPIEPTPALLRSGIMQRAAKKAAPEQTGPRLAAADGVIVSPAPTDVTPVSRAEVAALHGKIAELHARAMKQSEELTGLRAAMTDLQELVMLGGTFVSQAPAEPSDGKRKRSAYMKAYRAAKRQGRVDQGSDRQPVTLEATGSNPVAPATKPKRTRKPASAKPKRRRK